MKLYCSPGGCRLVDFIATHGADMMFDPLCVDSKTRLTEMLAFISTELHKQFGRMFKAISDAQTAAAREKISQRFSLIDSMLKGGCLFGEGG